MNEHPESITEDTHTTTTTTKTPRFGGRGGLGELGEILRIFLFRVGLGDCCQHQIAIILGSSAATSLTKQLSQLRLLTVCIPSWRVGRSHKTLILGCSCSPRPVICNSALVACDLGEGLEYTGPGRICSYRDPPHPLPDKYSLLWGEHHSFPILCQEAPQPHLFSARKPNKPTSSPK